MIAPKLDDEIDLVQELKLRRWARENYVPAAVRIDDDWHPIVLNEMRHKDEDVQQRELNSSVLSSFVPLAPTMTHIIHGAHSKQSRPTRVHSARETAKSWFQD